MLIKLLCVYRMTKYVGKILLWNSKRLLRKLQKNLRGLLFCRTLYNDDFILAAVCHPKFKLSWTDDPAEKSRCTHMLESVCESVATDVQSDSENAQSTDDDHDQFFVLHHSSTSSASSQCLSYLSDSDRSLDMLSRYPKIKAVFIKYNTALPSITPVEKAFSASSIILSKRR